MLTIDRVSGSLVQLTIDRPPANALTFDLLQTLLETFIQLSQETDPPAVVLAGAGRRFFCAGGDIREITTNPGVAVPRMQTFHRLLVALESYERPVVCAVNGYAVGGGLELVLYADCVVASNSALFGFPEINHGLLPAAKGIRQTVNRLGRRVAERLLYGGDLVPAKKARAIGLIDEVVSIDALQACALGQATKLRDKDMHLFSAIKRTFNDAPFMTDHELEERTISDMKDYLDRGAATAARQQFLQRRAK